jgi:hypothetical protein
LEFHYEGDEGTGIGPTLEMYDDLGKNFKLASFVKNPI